MLRHIRKELSLIRPITLIGFIGLIGLFGCTNDNEENGATQKKTLTVLPYYSSFLDVNEMPTRSLPSGYQPFSSLYPTSTPNHMSIALILTPNKTSVTGNTIRYVNHKWQGALDIQNNEQYWIYGYMPSEDALSASVTSPNGTGGADFANGAILTINGLNTLTTADVCVVVGVQKTEQETNIQDSGIQLGQFAYHGSDNNFVFLLLKHLYAGLHFKAHIDTEYAKLRTIKVKNMSLSTAEAIPTKINLIVPLTANTAGADPTGTVQYIVPEGTTSAIASTQLFPYEGSESEFQLPVETPQDFLSCFAPGKCRSFILTTTYDVYDKKMNLIRKDCTAVNHINATDLSGIDLLKAGEIYTLDMKVQPTYLYVLSDPDLDNPTFVVN